MVAPRENVRADALRRAGEVEAFRREGVVAREEVHVKARSDSVTEIPALFSELSRETTLLIHQEIALVRAEMHEKVSQLQRGAVALSTGAAVAYAGLLFLGGATAMALAYAIPLWLSALIVGCAFGIIGAVMLAKGRSDMKTSNLKPERTIESARETARVVRHAEEVSHEERR